MPNTVQRRTAPCHKITSQILCCKMCLGHLPINFRPTGNLWRRSCVYSSDEVSSYSHAHLRNPPLSSTEPTMTQARNKNNREQPDRYGLTPSLGGGIRHP